MAEFTDREHFIPLRKDELIDLLCADKALAAADQDLFRQFGRLVSATYHHQFHQRLEELKAAYAPFDPDRDTRPLVRLTGGERQERLNLLLRDFRWLMERANFVHLSRDDIEPTLKETSDWGVHTHVDFGAFEHLAIFARGDTFQKRTRRRWRGLYRLEEARVPTYQRLVMILKLRPDRKYGPSVNTDCVYLKVFKDIPKVDVKMLLPTARVRLTMFDRGKITFPLLTGAGAALFSMTDDVLRALLQVATVGPMAAPMLLWGIATGGIGYGYRSWYGYQQTKQRYHLTLTQSLYFQNLDSNAGVLTRLLDEAEEQEAREAILAYYFLWRRAGEPGWTGPELDDCVETYLEANAGLKVDFEIGDALNKLERMHVVRKSGDRYGAVPIEKALERLDWTWDNYFKYDSPAPEAPPSR